MCEFFHPRTLSLTLSISFSFSLFLTLCFENFIPKSVVWEMKNTFNFFCVVVAVAVASKMCVSFNLKTNFGINN